ncbi:hypothetical protein BpJC7_21120 [Weizmannia acidilactici]|uniref:Uncharacterized protein n=1 Tax=Weizmannia acidilactici TaxID=2607726 RepID=A0A5J4JHN3_9BACI|nr:hypothetical protein [Weizmannia acidilactici]GER70809.1 hypothetical protein BpJC7_21120 [Weizmannia acidilactici]GER74373.1 hypothetical protein BpPP18_24400 [Weizmannia acidilactici]
MIINKPVWLDLYRSLCLDNDKVEGNLYRLFYEETHEGKDMDEYKALLEKATDEIVSKMDQQMTINILAWVDWIVWLQAKI